jgi:hypothetical protein
MSNTGPEQRSQPLPPNETVASRLRKMAERISQLPSEVLASFQLNDPNSRVRKLQAVAAEVLYGMLPVISWLERKRPADKAALVKCRVHHVLREAVQCAGMDIPQYAGGTSARVEGEPSPGAFRTSELVAESRVFSLVLLD